MAIKRSPRYPSLTLEEALARVRQIYNAEHTHAASREVLVHHLGYNGLNGASAPVIGALNRYKLLEPARDGFRVSDIAVAIFEHGEESLEGREARREAAFAPTLFAEVREQFGDFPPSAANLKFWLIKRGFLPKAADEIVRIYRANLSFVGGGSKAGDEEDAAGREARVELRVGDFVQWESQGSLQFQTPKRVRKLSEDGAWAFVDGSNTGLPTKELTVAPTSSEVHTGHRGGSGAGDLPRAHGVRQDVFSLPEGEATFRWPTSLSRESKEDLKAWFEILRRKIARSAGPESETEV